MITIAFDEYGKFEQGEKSDFSIIAGFLYDDRDIKGEKDNELLRIQEFLKKVCASADAEYPVDMHYSSQTQRGRSQRVSEVFSKSLLEFITDGAYNRKRIMDIDREGVYYPFVFVKTKEGKTEYIKDGVGETSNDTLLSNLYIHMANDVINRMIFNNPCIRDIESVYFDLPTRVYVADTGRLGEKKLRYEALGHEIKKKENVDAARKNKDIVYIATKDMYRSSIEREIFHSHRQDMKVCGISVRSIEYRGGAKKTLESGFEYLSDLYCDAIHYGLLEKDIAKFPTRAKSISGNNSMVFYYDDTDTIFAEALESVRDRDIFKSLDLVFEGTAKRSDCREHYKNIWFPMLLEELNEYVDHENYAKAVSDLKKYSMSNNLNQKKLVYFVKKLEELGGTIADEDSEMVYDFCQVAATAYNHLGKSREAAKYVAKAKTVYSGIGLEKRLEINNKEIVELTDSLRFDEAVELAEKTQKAWDMVGDIRKVILGEESMGNNAGKAYSQMGQAYAFASDPRAEQAFAISLRDALNNSQDMLISLSYLLHYFAEQGMKSKYEKFSKIYFDNRSDLNEQFDYLVKEGSKGKNALLSLKFAMYVYIKGVYLFHMDKVLSDKALANKIMKIEESMEAISSDSIREINGHPWEIIYKYLSLITLKCGDSFLSKEYLDKSERIIKDQIDDDSHLLKAIIAYGKLEYYLAIDGKMDKKFKRDMERCWNDVMEVDPKIKKKYSDPVNRTYEELSTLMCYMYH